MTLPSRDEPQLWRRAAPPPPRWRVPRRYGFAAALVAVGVVLRRAVAALAVAALGSALHLVGVDAHLPTVGFGWPWQTSSHGRTATVPVGPWVLQRIERIDAPALGTSTFGFDFTHRVSKGIGPWPCWYASTFRAVGRASATVDLNPGAAWWRPGTGHYRLQVVRLRRPHRPGAVTVTVTLPRPRLPRSATDVTIDDLASRPIATDHSWTYPGLGCGVLLRPQFPPSVLYAEAQRIAYRKVTASKRLTVPLLAAARAEATTMIRDDFVQPTVNALGYRLLDLRMRWTTG